MRSRTDRRAPMFSNHRAIEPRHVTTGSEQQMFGTNVLALDAIQVHVAGLDTVDSNGRFGREEPELLQEARDARRAIQHDRICLD